MHLSTALPIFFLIDALPSSMAIRSISGAERALPNCIHIITVSRKIGRNAIPVTEQLIIFSIGIVTLGSGIWLLLHLRDVARVFRSEPDVAVGPGKKQAGRTTVIFMLILFNAGWIAALLFWTLVISNSV